MDYEQLLKEMSRQKDEMTTLERMMAYAKGEEVDHIPFYAYRRGYGGFPVRIYNGGLPERP